MQIVLSEAGQILVCLQGAAEVQAQIMHQYKQHDVVVADTSYKVEDNGMIFYEDIAIGIIPQRVNMVLGEQFTVDYCHKHNVVTIEVTGDQPKEEKKK
jgi:hypothetical protein